MPSNQFGPDLTSALATEGWRTRIATENATADKLNSALAKLQARRVASRLAGNAAAMKVVAMPTPPTSMALMMSRLSSHDQRFIASRRSSDLRTPSLSDFNLPYDRLAAVRRAAREGHGRLLAVTPYAPVKPASRAATSPGKKRLGHAGEPDVGLPQPLVHAPGVGEVPWR